MNTTPPRAIVTDDGMRICITVYDGDRATAILLSPERALTLALELLTAARRRLCAGEAAP